MVPLGFATQKVPPSKATVALKIKYLSDFSNAVKRLEVITVHKS